MHADNSNLLRSGQEYLVENAKSTLVACYLAGAVFGFVLDKSMGRSHADVHDLALLDSQTEVLAEFFLAEARERWDIVEARLGTTTESANVSVPRSLAPRAALAVCPSDQENEAFGGRGWRQVKGHLGSEKVMLAMLSCSETSIDAQLLRFP